MTNRNNVTSSDKMKHNQRTSQNINSPPLRSEGNRKHKSYDKHTTDQYQSDETTQPVFFKSCPNDNESPITMLDFPIASFNCKNINLQ